MVLTSFRSGLRDFFLQPSLELKHITRHPSRVGVGVLKGTLSLVSNSASGIFGFASNLGATVGHTATLLTMDEHYQRLHSEQKVAQQRHYDRWKKKGLSHVTLMVSRPVHDIVLGVMSASTGLLTEPYRGAKKGGIPGLIKGTSIGILGAIVKPIVGLSDAFSHVMESIDDIAKSMNLLELNFKPIERYRLPYVFGFKRMLLPFNEVDSRSTQLLLTYHLGKKSKLSEEIFVAAEALHVGNGIEHYVVVTTIRVVLIRLKIVEGQGFITTTLVWQVQFDKLSHVTCSLENKGHNGCFLVLLASRHSSRKQRDDVGEILEKLPYNEHGQNDNFFAEYESEYPSPMTSKNLRRPAATGCDSTRFVVEGEFKHREQLSKIHNAICCVSGDFDSIIHDRRLINKSEGITSFGPLIFEQESEIPPPNVAERNLFYASLESTMWKCPLSQSLTRCPPLLVASRSQGMPVETPLPSMPSYRERDDRVVAQSSSEPDICEGDFAVTEGWAKNDRYSDEVGGDIAFDVSLTSIDEVNSFDEIQFAHTRDSYGSKSFSVDFDESPFMVNSGNRPRSNQSNCNANPIDESLLSMFPQQSAQLAPAELESIDTDNIPNEVLAERLRRVEAMLERLLECDDPPPPNMVGVARLPSTQIIQNERARLDEYPPFNQLSPHKADVEALLTVTNDLKHQLLAKKDAVASTRRVLSFD